jgi:hypothetical protein
MPKSCSIEGCERSSWARGWCNKHYQRWRRCGDPLAVRPKFWASTDLCSVDGCEALVRSRGWCENHYQHWWRYGTTDYLIVKIEDCQIEGCERPPRSSTAGLCEVHYYRLRRTGRSDLSPYRVDEPSYRAAHSRVSRARGKAREHPCLDCGETGGHWSFAWRRVVATDWLWEIVNGTTLAYTGNPDDYDPRCHRCARRYDSDFAMQGWRATQTKQGATP